MRTEVLEKLREHFESTEFSQLQEQWNRIEQMGFEGPKAFDYIEFIGDFYCPVVERSCLPEGLAIMKNFTLNFSGYFFFCNIAA